MSSKVIPNKARVVIIGGGVIGCSVAYHLAKQGTEDVVLLERKQLTSGTTWHAAGLLTTLRDSESQTWLARYTQDLYAQLEQETGLATGLIQCGSVQLATTPEKVEEMRRGCTLASLFGIENREISADEFRDMWPLANADDVLAGFYFPNDGRVNPTDVTQSLARGARQYGAKLFEGIKVLDNIVENNVVTRVLTDHGEIVADVVVNCAGMWAREVGKLAAVDIPLQAAEHYYLVSDSIEGIHQDLPIIRDPGHCAYLREEGGGKLMLGFFEPDAVPWGLDGIPDSFEFDELQPDWERMEPHIERAMARLPALMEAGIQLFFCGPESFTPDHNYLMGKAPGLNNYFVAAGFNSLGILSGGGAGYLMANWIREGHPPLDVWDVDIRRTRPYQANAAFLRDRIGESLGIAYQMHWPGRQWQTARGVRQSPLHEALKARGARFGESVGWERPYWFEFAEQQQTDWGYGFGQPGWFENTRHEHLAVREKVGLFDLSSFSKFMVQGKDACAVLNHMATANVDVDVGKAVYTQFLNPRGGIEADLTITRLDNECFLVVTAAFTHTHVQQWIVENTPADANCTMCDVTDAYAVISVQGPLSRKLLEMVSTSDFSAAAFPFANTQEIEIGYQRMFALRISYTGELGWELYVPTSMAVAVHEQLCKAGDELELAHCGYFALNSLRAEKGFREWAHDISAQENPLQAGLEFTCSWDKPGGFIGRDALLEARAQGAPNKKLVQLLIDDPDPVLTHYEPVRRDDQLVGYTTSSGYGYSLGGSVALAYVSSEVAIDDGWLSDGNWTIEQAGRRYAARCSSKPMYDPTGARMRA